MINFYNYNLDKEIRKIRAQERRHSYSDLDYYSTGKILRLLYKIPWYLKLNAYLYLSIYATEFEPGAGHSVTRLPVLVTRQQQVDWLRTQGVDNALIVGSFFVRYKQEKGIRLSSDASGTLVFPQHTDEWVKAAGDLKGYAEQLKSLPSRFHPIRVCIYWHDLLLGRHKPFLDAGFPVYCAGHANDPDFVDNFYEILRHHKYSTTNMRIGTNCFYCIDFGIPVFFYGTHEQLQPTERFHETRFNWNDYEEIYFKKTQNLFSKYFPFYPGDIEITDELRKMCSFYLGDGKLSSFQDVRASLIRSATLPFSDFSLGYNKLRRQYWKLRTIYRNIFCK